MMSGDIQNLQATNLNISDTGRIYFDKDNTEQTTAYDPATVTARINGFLSSDNTFTGSQTYKNLNIVEPTTETKKTQITQSGANMIIENKATDSSILLKTTSGTSSASSNALFKESMGTACWTESNSFKAAPPTRCDSESEVIQSG